MEHDVLIEPTEDGLHLMSRFGNLGAVEFGHVVIQRIEYRAQMVEVELSLSHNLVDLFVHFHGLLPLYMVRQILHFGVDMFGTACSSPIVVLVAIGLRV